jgi:hypothetical protein
MTVELLFSPLRNRLTVTPVAPGGATPLTALLNCVTLMLYGGAAAADDARPAQIPPTTPAISSARVAKPCLDI